MDINQNEEEEFLNLGQFVMAGENLLWNSAQTQNSHHFFAENQLRPPTTNTIPSNQLQNQNVYFNDEIQRHNNFLYIEGHAGLVQNPQCTGPFSGPAGFVQNPQYIDPSAEHAGYVQIPGYSNPQYALPYSGHAGFVQNQNPQYAAGQSSSVHAGFIQNPHFTELSSGHVCFVQNSPAVQVNSQNTQFLGHSPNVLPQSVAQSYPPSQTLPQYLQTQQQIQQKIQYPPPHALNNYQQIGPSMQMQIDNHFQGQQQFSNMMMGNGQFMPSQFAHIGNGPQNPVHQSQKQPTQEDIEEAKRKKREQMVAASKATKIIKRNIMETDPFPQYVQIAMRGINVEIVFDLLQKISKETLKFMQTNNDKNMEVVVENGKKKRNTTMGFKVKKIKFRISELIYKIHSDESRMLFANLMGNAPMEGGGHWSKDHIYANEKTNENATDKKKNHKVKPNAVKVFKCDLKIQQLSIILKRQLPITKHEFENKFVCIANCKKDVPPNLPKAICLNPWHFQPRDLTNFDLMRYNHKLNRQNDGNFLAQNSPNYASCSASSSSTQNSSIEFDGSDDNLEQEFVDADHPDPSTSTYTNSSDKKINDTSNA